jgi:hypothetical protein
MNRRSLGRAALLLSALLAPLPAHAQDPDARVLRRGMLELRASGTFTHYDAFFDASGARRPLVAPLVAPLQEALERTEAARLGAARDALSAFFAGTGGAPAGVEPGAAGIGEVRMEASADIRTVPVTLAYGATDWLTIGVTVPVERRGTPVHTRHLAGGTLGLNPDVPGNTALLERIGESYGALGSSALFPTRDSPLGIALQQRVQALLGDTVQLALATSPLLLSAADTAGLTAEEQAALVLGSERTEYLLGDVQPGIRVRLLRGSAEGTEDAVRGPSLRSTLGLRARIPTGPRYGGGLLLEIPSEHGHAGWGVDLANEVHLNARLSLDAAAVLDVRFPADVQRRAFAADRPFPGDTALRVLRREPGARLAIAISPRFRLTEEISLAGRYGLLRQGETRLSGHEGIVAGPTEPLGPWTGHAVGFGARYSTRDAYAAGRAAVPMEVSLVYENTVAGSGGAPAARRLHVTGRLFAPARLLTRIIAASAEEEEEEGEEAVPEAADEPDPVAPESAPPPQPGEPLPG